MTAATVDGATTPWSLPWGRLLVEAEAATSAHVNLSATWPLRLGVLSWRADRGHGIDAHAVLAGMVLNWHAHDPAGFAGAVADLAGGQHVDELVTWAVEAADDYADTVAKVHDDDDLALATARRRSRVQLPAPPGTLSVLDDRAEDALRRLEAAGRSWLVDLLEDVARCRPGGLAFGSCDAVLIGGRAYIDAGAVLIVTEVPDDRLAFVVAHELAHHLDPRVGQLGRASDEWFADRLAADMLDHQVRTLEGVAPLITNADTERPPAPHTTVAHWPAADWRTWGALDLAAR